MVQKGLSYNIGVARLVKGGCVKIYFFSKISYYKTENILFKYQYNTLSC